MDSILSSLDKNIYFLENLENTKLSLEKQKESLESRNNSLVTHVKDLNTALEYYKQAVDIVYNKTIKSLEAQLTDLMQEVFTGCNYGVIFDIEDLRGVKNLIIEFIDDTYQGNPEDFGGSLETIVGYLFHLMYLIKSGKPRILFMDEFFRDVNDEYLGNLIELINRLTKSTNSVNVLITHIEELKCLSEAVYTVREGNYELDNCKV